MQNFPYLCSNLSSFSILPSPLCAESVRDALGRKVKLSLRKRVKLEIKGDKTENRVLVSQLMLLSKSIINDVSFQLLIEYERGSFSLKLLSTEEVNEVVAHIGNCLLRICPGLPPNKVMKKLCMEPPDRLTSLQTLWENNKPAEPGPCGGFSQMYRCVCDWLGLPYREEVQWDVDTIYLTQDTRELNLQDFSHLENRDLVAIIAVLEFNQWFTKLSTKDYKLSADVCEQILRVVSRSSRLEELVLENAGLKTDFAQKLAAALAHNPSSGLTTINLANNPLEDRGMISALIWSNVLISGLLLSLLLATLDLSNTDCSLDQVCSALLRGSVQHLSVLNVSKSVFPHRKGKEVPPSFKHFFSSAMSLSSINVSGTKLPPEALKALLLGLASNPNLKDVSLDLSCCELRSGGSQILEGCIAEIPNISSLDISDNGLDSDLSTLLVWLAKNRMIVLYLLFSLYKPSQYFFSPSSLHPSLPQPLTSLSLADSRLKSDLTIVLNALGSNSSLTRLDISGNAMGDMGAKMLAKALQINSKLRTVIWDKNNTSPQGLQDVAAALEKNFTIRFMPIPIIDASQALKASPEKTEDALLKIENYLYRNHETRKYLQEQAYRLQQGIVTTTTQQMIDRICVKVQDHLNSLRNSETDAILEDVRSAENLIKDARNSKTLLPNLYHLGSASREEVDSSSVGPIQEKLESMAGEVTTVMDQQLQTLLESMVDTAESLCPHVMKSSNLRPELMKASSAKMVVPKSFVTKTLLEQSGVDIINKISEVKLSLASFLSDRIVDEILEALSASQHTLMSALLNIQNISNYKPTEMEFDLDKALEDVPIHVEDTSTSSQTPPTPSQVLPKLEQRPAGTMVELPSEEEKKLQHFTKLRPRRNKKIHSSKQINSAPSQDGEQNGLMGRVDEGVDDFFSKKVTKMDSK
uniref:Capping protein regulator and myosin 1 linker 1 n=1 Tax=Lates calcarifer TaxID=8187 RepID=A0A4W6C404_LATCA